MTGLEIPVERPRYGAMKEQPRLSWRLEDIGDSEVMRCSPR